ncbi:MAG: carbohydrate kinase family protein [Bacilli bacterium]|nr:carbohydrate kinase family protein [Bacilli bacterium]
MKVVCVGHSTYDTTLPMDLYPTENSKYRINKHIECGGGPASNGAYLLAKWGMDTTIVSIVGDDYYGDKVIEDFKNIGADITYLEKKENHMTSSSYIIANMSNGSRTIITSKKPPIRKLSKPVNIKADVILVDGEHPETAIEVLKNNPDAISVLDAGRYDEDRLVIGKLVKYVVCSKEFAEKFSETEINVNNIDTLITAYEKLKDYYKTNIIITLEAAGSFTEIDGKPQIIPSIKVTSLDSTGAGDIFHGAFTYFISNGYSLIEAIHFSSVTAAISVTRIGSRYSIPELREVFDYDDVI